MVIEALRWPGSLGVKVTSNVQLVPAPRLEPHVLLWSRSKIRGVGPRYRHAVDHQIEPPVLVNVSTCGGTLVVPTTTTGKLKLAGARLRAGGLGGADGPLPGF